MITYFSLQFNRKNILECKIRITQLCDCEEFNPQFVKLPFSLIYGIVFFHMISLQHFPLDIFNNLTLGMFFKICQISLTSFLDIPHQLSPLVVCQVYSKSSIFLNCSYYFEDLVANYTKSQRRSFFNFSLQVLFIVSSNFIKVLVISEGMLSQIMSLPPPCLTVGIRILWWVVFLLLKCFSSVLSDHNRFF